MALPHTCKKTESRAVPNHDRSLDNEILRLYFVRFIGVSDVFLGALVFAPEYTYIYK